MRMNHLECSILMSNRCFPLRARKGFFQGLNDNERGVVAQVTRMSIGIANKGVGHLENTGLLVWTYAHDPPAVVVYENQQILHCLHIPPALQRCTGAWNVRIALALERESIDAFTLGSELAGCFKRMGWPRRKRRGVYQYRG